MSSTIFFTFGCRSSKVALHLHKVEGFSALSRCWTRPIRLPMVAVARDSPEIASPQLH